MQIENKAEKEHDLTKSNKIVFTLTYFLHRQHKHLILLTFMHNFALAIMKLMRAYARHDIVQIP